jgi:predicted GNAT family N-acyltransferase
MENTAPDAFQIRFAQWPAEQSAIQHIRYPVFQVEQGVAAALEFDGRDAAAQHVLALWQGHPVGTARLRWLTPQVVKVERVAVLAAFRRRGIGRAIMIYILANLDPARATEVCLNAQMAVEPFYRQLGFESEGAVFEEAGIPHVKMRMIFGGKGHNPV